MLRLIIAPNGVAYAPPEARPGILPRLLQEILSTRIMVKAAMKRAPKSAKVAHLNLAWLPVAWMFMRNQFSEDHLHHRMAESAVQALVKHRSRRFAVTDMHAPVHVLCADSTT